MNESYISLEKLISKYSQIVKLAESYHQGYCLGLKTRNKNERERAVLHYLLELKEIKDRHEK